MIMSYGGEIEESKFLKNYQIFKNTQIAKCLFVENQGTDKKQCLTSNRRSWLRICQILIHAHKRTVPLKDEFI